jgi:hypothetical protein
MDTTAERLAGRRDSLGWRLLRGGAAVVATVTLGLALTAGPADAMPDNPCATARAIFKANMDEARFWIGAADRLAGAGNEAGANAASAEADHFMGLAEGALGDMGGTC